MDPIDQKILKENEINANRAIARGSLAFGIILLVLWIGFLTGLLSINSKALLNVNISFPIFIVLLGLSIFYSHTKLVEKAGFKYFIIAQFIVIIFILNMLLPKHAVLGWAACIIMVVHYFNPKLSLFAFATVLILMFIAIYVGMLYGEWDSNLMNGNGMIDIDGVLVEASDTTYEQRVRWLQIRREMGDNRYLRAFLFYYIPRVATLTLIGYIAHALTNRTARLINIQARQAGITARMQGELEMAKNIQNSVLPTTLNNDHQEDVAALMDPAKEIGGDFYDYFMVDETHLALVIADVSGKGVPGALFMMKAETLIKSLAQSLKSDTANIIARSNIALCGNNEADMFVTCWLGIMDLSTGELKFTNAGHNNPIIIQGDKVKYMNYKHGLVLGALEDAKYTENTIKLNRGDKIILYTDGVTEAHNQNSELYGEARLLEYTNEHIKMNPKNFISDLREELRKFSDGYEQFDDITMLMFEYQKGAMLMESRIFKADVSELDNLFAYSSTLLKILNFSNRDIIMINTALEEVFVNVAHYAYDKEGTVEVSLSNDKNNVTFIFKDSGKKFNPLEKKDPNINASSDEREIGGLGIFMVKNIMDEVIYKYEDGHNVLTLIKKRK